MTLREGSWGCAAPLCLGGVRTSLGADRLAASGPHDRLRWRAHDTHVLGVPMRRCPTAHTVRHSAAPQPVPGVRVRGQRDALATGIGKIYLLGYCCHVS